MLTQRFGVGASRTTAQIIALATIALAACTDQSRSTLVQPNDPNRIVACSNDCGGGTPIPASSVAVASLSGGPYEVNGDLLTQPATAILSNVGATTGGASYTWSLDQAGRHYTSPSIGVNCLGFGTSTIPHGSCVTTFFIDPRVLTGASAFQPGPAMLTYALASPNGTATKSVTVTLTIGVQSLFPLDRLSLDAHAQELFLGFMNTGPVMTGLHFQVRVIQGSASRTALDIPLQCMSFFSSPGDSLAAPAGTLPANGLCLVRSSFTSSNSQPGTGTLASGPALVELSVVQNGALAFRRTMPTTILDGHFTAASVSDSGVTINGGTSHGFTATATSNIPASMNIPASVTGTIRQGTVTNATVSAQVSCNGSTIYSLGATCVVSGSFTVVDPLPSKNIRYQSGPAFLDINFIGQVVGAGFPLDTIDVVSVPITLRKVDSTAKPTIGAVTVGTATIGSPGPLASLAVKVGNAGVTQSDVSMRMLILQGTAERHATDGAQAFDCGKGTGVIPTDGCTVNTTFFASNTAPGTGTFVAGPAKLIIYFVDPSSAVLATKTVPLVLAGP